MCVDFGYHTLFVFKEVQKKTNFNTKVKMKGFFMKRIFTLTITVIMCFSFCACSNNETAAPQNEATTSPTTINASPTLETTLPTTVNTLQVPSIGAAAVINEGPCGATTTYKLYDNGVLTVSGTGEITDTFTKFNDYIKYIKIEEGVTSIGNKAFADLNSCEIAELPSTLKIIKTAAFANSSHLVSVNLPEGLDIIERNAFYFTNLKSADVPGTVDYVDAGAFSYCAIEELYIRNGVGEIRDNAFAGNEMILVVIPGSVKNVGADAFSNCKNLETVILCDGVEYIAGGALENIKSLAVPNSVNYIGFSDMGQPNPTNDSSKVYCNDGSYATTRFSTVTDIIVGYDGFIKNYNIENYI